MLSRTHVCTRGCQFVPVRVLPCIPNPGSDAWSAAAADALLSLTAAPAVLRERDMGVRGKRSFDLAAESSNS